MLFGANAAGKTSVLDALAVVLSALVARSGQAKGRGFAKNKSDIRIPWQSGAHENPGAQRPYVRIQATGPGGLKWDKFQLRSPSDLREVPSPRAGLKALHAWLDPLLQGALNDPHGEVAAPVPLVASYGNERAVVAMPQRKRAFQRTFSRLTALDDALNPMPRFKSVFEWFIFKEDEERRERERRRNWDYRLPELDWVRRAIKAAELRCSNPRIELKPLRMLVDFEHKNGEYQALDLRALSDGFRTHFSLVVDLARRMVQLNPSTDLDDPNRGTNSPAVVLIDEVDLHLDPHWQGRVVQGLLNAFPKAQFVLSTHSEQVIASVNAEQVRKLAWSDGEIIVERVPFAQGSTGERILVDLMDAPIRVDGPVKKTLDKYLLLVSSGHGQAEEALELRGELDRLIPGDSALHCVDLELQRDELLKRLNQP